jgi:hypothetical protein
MDSNAKSISEPCLDETEVASCDSRFSRKEFLRRFVAPAVVTGVLLQPARIVDKFSLQPPAAANTGAAMILQGQGTMTGYQKPDWRGH